MHIYAKYVFNHPPPRVVRSVVGRVAAGLVCAALFAAVLFGVSVAVDSEPATADGAHNVDASRCRQDVSVASSATTTTTFTVDFGANGCLTTNNNQYFCRYVGKHIGADGDLITSVSFQGNPIPGGVRNWRNMCKIDITVKAGASGTQAVRFFWQVHTHSTAGTFNVIVRPPSDLSFQAPSALSVPVNGVLTVDASGYASESHSSYTISCGDAESVSSARFDVSRDGCIYTLTAKTQGSGSFTVPYMSSSGTGRNGTISVSVGAASNITFTAPTGGITVSATGLLDIDASDYVTHASYTISCGEPKNIGSAITVSRRGDCNYRIGGRGTAGSASFTVPYISTSGAVSITSERSLSVTVGPASAIFLNGFALLDNTVNLIAAGS